MLLEELGRTSLTAASILNSAIGAGCAAICDFGSDAQRREWLPLLLRGEIWFACALAPAFSCGEMNEIAPRAIADGDHYVIDGGKNHALGAASAHRVIVAAHIGPAAIGLFALDPQTPGLSMRERESLGMRGAGGLYELNYNKARAPCSALLNSRAGGRQAIEALLDRDGIFQAAYCIGCAQQVVDDAVRYAGEREQFGQPIGKLQAIAHLLADLQVQVDAARWLMYRAASAIDGGQSGSKEAAMADLACTDALQHATSQCMRVYGGYGLTMEFDIQRHFRDARMCVRNIGERHFRRHQIAHAMELHGGAG